MIHPASTTGEGRRPTMADVAALVGLHPSSVSLALRNSPAIAEATRERVRQAAESLGYRRDPHLDTFNFRRRAACASHPFQSVVYVSDAVTWDQYDEDPARRSLLEGVVAACRGGGIGFDRFLVGPGRLTANRLQQILRTRNTDSVVIGPLVGAMRRVELDWSADFAAGIETFDLEPALDLMSSNYRQAGMLAVEALARLGYQRLGVVLPSGVGRSRDELLRLGVLTARECSAGSVTVEIYDGPRAGVGAWVERGELDVVVGPDNGFAVEVVQQCPGTAYAVMDLGDARPGVAGVRHSHSAVGTRVVESLMQKRYINQRGLPLYPTRSFVPVGWVDGASAPRRA